MELRWNWHKTTEWYNKNGIWQQILRKFLSRFCLRLKKLYAWIERPKSRRLLILGAFIVSKCQSPIRKGESMCCVNFICWKEDDIMHKPRRRTKYFERFYFEYEGILYLSKKNCCEKLGFEYGSVLGYRHTNNCSFTEALDHFMEIREQNQFVFRNRNWLNLDNCCEFYGVNKFTSATLPIWLWWYHSGSIRKSN